MVIEDKNPYLEKRGKKRYFLIIGYKLYIFEEPLYDPLSQTSEH